MSDIKSKKSILTATLKAEQQLAMMMIKAPENAIGIKLGLKNAGCAGVSYVMNYAFDTEGSSETIEIGTTKIIIDMKSLLFLIGLEMDYQVSQFKSGFVFNNPNQTDVCGCGESVKLVAVDYAAGSI